NMTGVDISSGFLFSGRAGALKVSPQAKAPTYGQFDRTPEKAVFTPLFNVFNRLEITGRLKTPILTILQSSFIQSKKGQSATSIFLSNFQDDVKTYLYRM
ncbi:MAG: hypothetical protein KJ002_14920, partial [Candidatus Dadabacteria bacterium]|nr:hypothetical protein [Candidatus Dadabacteria bacterium]